jgi:hypothetical protein
MRTKSTSQKTVCTALPKAKAALHQTEASLFEIGIAELKVKPVEGLGIAGAALPTSILAPVIGAADNLPNEWVFG